MMKIEYRGSKRFRSHSMPEIVQSTLDGENSPASHREAQKRKFENPLSFSKNENF